MTNTNEQALADARNGCAVRIVRTLNGHAVQVLDTGETVREFGRIADAREFAEKHGLDVV